jgi:hypothetical protein
MRTLKNARELAPVRLWSMVAVLHGGYPLDARSQADVIGVAIRDLVGLHVAQLIRAAYGRPVGRKAREAMQYQGGPEVARVLALVARGRGLGVPRPVVDFAFAERDPPLRPIGRKYPMARPTRTIQDFLKALRHATSKKGYDVRLVRGGGAANPRFLVLHQRPNGSLWSVLEVVYDAYYRPAGSPQAVHPGQACGLSTRDARLVRRAAGAHPGHNKKLRKRIWQACDVQVDPEIADKKAI